MRRLRLPRLLLSVFLALCFLLFTLHAFLRVNLSFGVETRLYRHPPPSTGFYTRAQETVASGTEAPSLHFYAGRPWFMRGGLVRPHELRGTDNRPRLWPHEDSGDRITDQLMYVPQEYKSYRNSSNLKLKRILLYFGQRGWSDLPMGRTIFQRDRCPVDTCEISINLKTAEAADLVLFKDRFSPPTHKRSPKQIWLLFLLECPQHTQSFAPMAGLFNWTATYRHDSDIVAPYEKFVSYPDRSPADPPRNYAAGKRKKVAWFVSNCAARNKRLQYARQLSKFIQVDMYGKCGTHRCPRTRSNRCFQRLNKDYKFYLAFENSNCKDYITEKFFVNGLGHDIIPIVMGARPEDYVRASPKNSYIHVEDFSGPEELAQFLHHLDGNDTLYNSYFRWKAAGEFINTRFWCRLCALLHAPVVPKVYTDLQTWWAGKGTCTSDEWRRKQSEDLALLLSTGSAPPAA